MAIIIILLILLVNIANIESNCIRSLNCPLSYRYSSTWCFNCVYNNVSNPRIYSLYSSYRLNVTFISSNMPTLTNITFTKPEQIEALKISNGNVSTVENLAFNSYKNLFQLDLSYNNIKKIQYGAFLGAKNLEILNYSHNAIELIEDGAFHKTTSFVKKIDVSYNRLSALRNGSFGELLQLKELYLAGNKLSVIEDGVFNELANLTLLDLSNQNISKLGRRCFDGMMNLTELRLDGNQIRVVDTEVFINLRLVKLNLSRQKLTLLDNNLFHMFYLEDIDLSYNSISRIEIGAFKNLPVIQNVDLSHNNILIDSDTLQGLSNCKRLDLSFNKIENIVHDVFDNTKKLSQLNLSNNLITDIPTGTFGHLNSLKWLDLSHNFIQDLGMGMFVGLSSLNFLNVGYNHIIEISDQVFLNTPGLIHLLINNNLLQNFGNSLKILKLVEINFDDNDFNCDYLSELILQLTKSNVSIKHGTANKNISVLGIPCNNEFVPPPTTSNYNLAGLMDIVNDLKGALSAPVEQATNPFNDQVLELLRDIKELLNKTESESDDIFNSLALNGSRTPEVVENTSNSGINSASVLIVICLIVLIILSISQIYCKFVHPNGSRYKMKDLSDTEAMI